MSHSTNISRTLGAAVCALLILCGAGRPTSRQQQEAALAAHALTIDYPGNGAVFPPEITAPKILWRDTSAATHWKVEARFISGEKLRFDAPGEPYKRVELDPEGGPAVEISAQLAATKTWQPDAETWTKIKQRGGKASVTIAVTGYGALQEVLSQSEVSIIISADVVGAPIFYRDVPLMMQSASTAGPIQPLPPSAMPLIKWRVRNLAEPSSHVVMEHLPTCANCHSFSADGKTFGLDLDGPRNDKGLYALVPVQKQMTIAATNMIRWSSFQLNNEVTGADAAVKRFGFMSQVSPDGRYVITSIGPPNNTNKHAREVKGFAPGILDRLYSTNFRDIRFTQVFYPTRGILAWYDVRAKSFKPLPGADDPKYVHTSAFWSPDGKYLIFSRALARDPYPPGVPRPKFANDPNETQIQYDLYKIPFNDGRGGVAEPVEGASNNGMSNDFPKVSPDGKWIVWVRNKNGLLMRPDSQLWIVPFAGGKPRLMHCNTPLMNSWHTFSPNGRWLAFSSKGREPYTQLMLTHIDEEGNDTPAVMVENTTAGNRAVNIPEFVNVPADGLEKIDPQATEYYSLFDTAYRQMEANQMAEAVATMRKAVERDPEESFGHYMLATALTGNEQEAEALTEYRKACELDPRNPAFLDHLAISLDLNGHVDEAIDALRKAISLLPSSPEYHFNLAVVLESKEDFAGAIEMLREAIQLSGERNWRGYAELGKVYVRIGKRAEALDAGRNALRLAEQEGNQQAVEMLRQEIQSLEAGPQ